jgi:hypothetical protein
MNDAELRGQMLHYFYDNRRQGYTQMLTNEFLDQNTAFDICRQLSEHGLLNWKPLVAQEFRTGMGQITATGIDVVEGTQKPPPSISISLKDVQIGKGNIQNTNITARDIAVAIDNAKVDQRTKEEAKSLMNRLLQLLNIGS